MIPMIQMMRIRAAIETSEISSGSACRKWSGRSVTKVVEVIGTSVDVDSVDVDELEKCVDVNVDKMVELVEDKVEV